MPNKQLKPTSTALLVLRLNATLAQNNQLRSGGLAGCCGSREHCFLYVSGYI
jgi:hypothetical protein